jgi:non-specific serine/threonine protein kinase
MDGPELLTPRQRQVAILVEYGLTNRQIAEQLVISERTAAAHVEQILNRLGYASRHQVADWAAEQRLLASLDGFGRTPPASTSVRTA